MEMNDKNKLALGLFGVAVVLVAGFLIARYQGTTPSATARVDEFTKYFEREIIDLAINDIGQPIEGFDAESLKMAYPGLLDTDFDGVQTFEGRYIIEAGELSYMRTSSEPVTSAEQTISEDGYATLLSNLSDRLNIEPTEEGINKIISTINVSEILKVKLGQTSMAHGVAITPISVLGDSRCPASANCIQAGTVVVKTNVMGEEGKTTSQTFTLGEKSQVGDVNVVLEQVLPQVTPGHRITASEYEFWFNLSK